jgi:hypothetical protein
MNFAEFISQNPDLLRVNQFRSVLNRERAKTLPFPTRSQKEENVLPVPEGMYGFVSNGVKYSALQTSGIKTCTGIAGFGPKGYFLTHINPHHGQHIDQFLGRLEDEVSLPWEVAFITHNNEKPDHVAICLSECLKRGNVSIFSSRPSISVDLGIDSEGVYVPNNFVQGSDIYGDFREIGQLRDFPIENFKELVCANDYPSSVEVVRLRNQEMGREKALYSST